jgi:hypothetical protein
MTPLSQTVTIKASPIFHNLCGAPKSAQVHNVTMDNDKNGGPNHLKAWREYRGLTQAELGERVVFRSR